MAVAIPAVSLALLGGLVTVLSPCILPVLPVIVGRSLQSHRLGPLALVAGLICGFASLGSLLGITASWFTGLVSALRMLAIVLLLCLGGLAMFPSWSYRLFGRLSPSRWLKQGSRTGWAGEFWVGTQLGLLWSPCAGPVLASILLVAALRQDVVAAFVLLLFYGLGAALPLLVIAYGGRYASRRLLSLRAHAALVQRLGGVLVAATAIAILLGWDIQLQLWLAPLFPPLAL